MGLGMPAAVNLFTGLPIEVGERAWKASTDYYDAHGPVSTEAHYRAKLDAIAAQVGHDVARTWMFQEVVISLGDDEEFYETVCNWIDAWFADQKGAN